MEKGSENYLGHYAGFTSRLIAYTLDLVISIAGITILWWLVSITLEILKIQEVIQMLGWENPFEFMTNQGEEFVLRGFVFIFGIGVYHVFFLTLANRTIGKSLMGLQVVPLKGGRIGPVRAVVRYLGYIVSILPVFLGFFWILISGKRQGWHDKIARTCVVYTWEAQTDDVFLRHRLDKLHQVNKNRFGSPLEKRTGNVKERSDE